MVQVILVPAIKLFFYNLKLAMKAARFVSIFSFAYWLVLLSPIFIELLKPGKLYWVKNFIHWNNSIRIACIYFSYNLFHESKNDFKEESGINWIFSRNICIRIINIDWTV